VVASLRLLSLGSSGLGVLMAAAGVGALAAIIAATLLIGNRRLADWFGLGLLLCGLPIAAIGLIGSPAPAIVLMVVWGVGMSLSDVGAQALLNRIVPAASIGGVTGAMESGKLVFEGFGSLVAPALLVTLGVRGAVIAAGGILPVVVLLGGRSFARIDDRAVARVEILELLRRVPFFVPLRLDALEGVASRLQTEVHTKGTEIVRQGDLDAHRWYLVDSGELVVEVDGFLVGELRRGDQFGERGLLRGVPRAATVRALSEVVLYALERDDFLAAVAGPDLDETQRVALPHHIERVEPSAALARAPLLHGISAAALDDLNRQTRVHEVEAGTPIVVSGVQDDTYHVLLSGRAQVMIDGAVRRELLPGDAFGEIAILHRVPRTASVVARDQSTVLTVDGEAVRNAVREHGGAMAALAS
jgi:CRP-like cAMP-binding protein